VTLRLGLLLALAAICLGAALVFATRSQRGYRQPLIAILPRADGVREGTLVTYLGLQVGQVRRLRIHDGRVVAELRVRGAESPLRRGDSLRLRTLGLLGDKVLDVVPGQPGGPPLRDGDTLFVAAGPQLSPEEIWDSLRGHRERDSAKLGPNPPSP